MKYTILGFDQAKLVEYGLDVNDAMILRWLIDFAATGKMKKALDKNTHNVFYLVNYEAVIKEFPVMGINTTKAIANRFDKYVEKGLLLKTVKKGGGSSGTQTLFSITQLIGDMIYSEDNVNTTFDSNQTSYRNENQEIENISDRNQTSCRNEESDSNLTSYRKKSDKNQTSYRSESNFLSKGIELPVALNNPSTNSSTNSSSSQNYAEEEQKIQRLLGYYVDVRSFSDDFVPKLHQKLREFNINPKDYDSFVDFAYTECQKKVKSNENLLSYMYSSLADNFFISKFLEKNKQQIKKQEEIQKNKIICPVCGYEHLFFETCPRCGLDNPKDVQKIEFYSKIYILPKEKRENLEKEINLLTKEFLERGLNKNNYTELKIKKEKIYSKYLQFSHEDYIKIFG